MIFATLFLTTSLTVVVENVRSEDGQLYVSIQNEGQFGKPTGTAGNITDPETGEMRFDYSVPAGTYAVSVWHDEDDNGQFDYDERGMPADGYAISGEGSYAFGKAAVEIDGSSETVTVRMVYPD